MRVVVIDDHPLYRDGVIGALSTFDDITVVADGSSADDALEYVTALQPDILLLDLDIPGGGLSVIEGVGAASPSTRVVMLTFDATQEHLLEALSAGVTSYVLKGVTARELTQIIRAAHAGQGYVPPELGARMLSARAVRNASHTASRLSELTEREHQILTMVREGRTNLEIAQALCLAETTVKNSMTAIMQKLQVRNRVEAAIVAHQEAIKTRPLHDS